MSKYCIYQSFLPRKILGIRSKMSKKSERIILESTPIIKSQKRAQSSVETSAESSPGSDSSHSSPPHTSIDTSLSSPLPVRSFNQIIPSITKEFELKLPTNDVFDEMRPILQSFYEEHKSEFQKLNSFYCTIGIINNKNKILVGAECDPTNFKISDKYKDQVVVTENKIRQAVKMLSIGCSIGVFDDNSSIGTLGCFVYVDGDLHGLTCYHVIPNEKKFQYPCAQGLSRFNVAVNDNFYAGHSNEKLGILTINHKQLSILDYQLLKLEQEIQEPYNAIKYKDKLNLIKEEVTLENIVDLNNKNLAMSFIDKRQEFAKLGAVSNFTFGYLYNSARCDAYVKVGSEGTNIEYHRINVNNVDYFHTHEFSIICTGKYLSMPKRFAQNGDSGSIVYCQKSQNREGEGDLNSEFDTKIAGMVHAVADKYPYFAYFTPITDIINDLKERQNKTLSFPVP